MSFSVRLRALAAASLCGAAWSHGWVTSPPSKNEMAANHYVEGMPDDFRYEPQSSNHGNLNGQSLLTGGSSCGAVNASYTDGLTSWKKWYDAAKVSVPKLVPGQDLAMHVTLTIDHGGQAWFMIACDDFISENSKWTFLERSKSDRAEHFMPSTPTAFAWAPLEYQSKGNSILTSWTVPPDFACPSGRAVGRWLWKTGNSCNDVDNVGRKTTPFSAKEFTDVVHAYQPNAWVQEACTSPPESFISCMDFVIESSNDQDKKFAASDPVNSCHEAAKAFCDDHNFCHTCQAWGTWGNMFFATVCNDDPSVCHEPVTAADGTVCSCQVPGGCKVDGVTCPGPNSTVA